MGLFSKQDKTLGENYTNVKQQTEID